MGKKYQYNIGDVYGIQKILDLYNEDKNGLMAKVECIKCGNIKDMRARQLPHEKYNSCKCQIVKHGMNRTKIYSIYANIKYRCFNSNHHEFHNYGGKGVTVCEEWLGENGFENFYIWALNNGYIEGLSIDRIDENGNYEPTNCQWITRNENTAKANKTCQHRKADKGIYYGIDPNGNKYEFDNANQFAREYNLNANCVRQVANGAKRSHHGWIFGFVSETS